MTDSATAEPPALKGIPAVEATVARAPGTAGVYRMFDAKGGLLYVGKARNLKKRLYSYTQPEKVSARIHQMVLQIASIELTTTHTEAQALLLEANYIKSLKPRYNIVLRDDKSYPWIVITEDHPFPQISRHRGAQVRKGSYWGPFASAATATKTVTELQRVFLLRSCSDRIFANRSRPCLLFQTKRCSAPCVGRIDEAGYKRLVRQSKDFLSGNGARIQTELQAEMTHAAVAMEYERAAALRDRLRSLSSIQSATMSNPQGIEDADVMAILASERLFAIIVFFIRGGHNNGSREYFLDRHAESEADALSAFIMQFYDDKMPPPLVLTSAEVPEADVVKDALSEKAGRRVEVTCPQRGPKRTIVTHAETNAREALERRKNSWTSYEDILANVAQIFHLPDTPQRIEVYDNSHISGTNAYGAMIVYENGEFHKNAYRKFKMDGQFEPGDDYGMMRAMLTRRFARMVRELASEDDKPAVPDLALIDGGAGQLKVAREVLADLGVNEVTVASIAKGEDRNAGREQIYLTDGTVFELEPNQPVLHFLQRLRDEAHRFAITTHRAARAKLTRVSELEEIGGIGPAKKRALLNRFGSVREIKRAGLADLEMVPNLGKETAQRIYAYFHD